MDAVRVEASHRHDLLDLRNTDTPAGRSRLVAVARGLAENKVAALVGLPALDDRQIRADAAFKDVFLAVELLGLFAHGDLSPVAGLGVKTRDARAARAHPLGERALGAEFHLELAGEILPLELLVLADIGRDHLRHLPRAQQLAEAFIVDPGIVRGDGQVLAPARLHRIDQPLGDSAQPEPAGRNGHAIVDQSVERYL